MGIKKSNDTVELVVKPSLNRQSPEEQRTDLESWGFSRLSKSRGSIELLMVFVQGEERAGHASDYPSQYEKRFVEFCSAPV